ncbi:GBF-interacting protein 1-like isoform X1 [Actinidia eriantha]|uniref:GBF-interacting protein 1-like isoform X1 n=1 Tax=Actinidia eriantha TaxID=165200 RepID=UPI002590CD3C|nr:GBF-interacting protein 1-like isoform X1 [Actinidia eriantha]
MMSGCVLRNMNNGARVLIPSNIRKTVQDIKEIARNHNDDDIYAMLQECNMDPDETAQRLLYLDTFQEVKKKRDFRKVNVNGGFLEESRWRTGTQGRGFRGGRGAGGARSVSARKENGVSMERGFKSSLKVPEKMENSANSHVTNSSNISVNGPTSASNGSSSHESCPKPSAVVYSSASDPVVVPPLTSRNPGVGVIKHGVSGQRTVAEPGAPDLVVNSSSTAHDVANNIQAASGDVTSMKAVLKEPLTVEKNQPLQPSQLSNLTTSYGSSEVISNQDGQSSQQLIGSSIVVASEAASLAVESDSQSLPVPEVNVPVLEDVIPKLDTKLKKLHISARQPVVFPDHIQVSEDFMNGLTFGSLDLTVEQSVNCVDSLDDGKGSMPAPELLQENDKAPKQTSLSNLFLSSTVQEGDCYDNQHSPALVPGNSAHLEGNVSSGITPKYDQLKQDIMFSQGGPQFPFVPIPNYGYPFLQPIVGSQLVQCEGPECQTGNSLVSSTMVSTTTAPQTAGVGQSSIAVSQPHFPVFRQPYPPNYFPFYPYFPPFYLAPNAQQFLGHSGFPQQPSIENVYLSPAAAAPGVKFSFPQGKLGITAGNLAQFGVPSAYNSYNPSPAVTSGSSAGNEDIVSSVLKENSLPTMAQQGEGPLVWLPPSGRDTLHANSFYHQLPPGQHVALSPPPAGQGPFAAIYHQMPQTTPAT